MKNSVKKIISGVALTGVALSAVISSMVLTSAKLAERNSIGQEKAVEAAVKDAGINAKDIIKTKTDFEKENGEYVFEVEFDANGMEYDYIIDAKDGSVLRRDTEKNDDIRNVDVDDNLTGNGVSSDESDSQNIVIQNVPETDTEVENSVAQEQKPIENNNNRQTDVNVYNYKTETTESFVEKYISKEKAEDVAFADAGISRNSAHITKSLFESDDGVKVYDIEFVAGNKEYEYEVDAITGRITDKDVEAVENKPVVEKTTVAQTQNVKPKEKQQSYIGVDAAKSKALSDSGENKNNVTFRKAVLEKDDGVYYYDIEFVTDLKEYEYEIDALSGRILEKDFENIVKPTQHPTEPATQSVPKNISVDKAKEIALNHAGLNASDVIFIKAKLEKDDGVSEYEIEFVYGEYEYSYEINAKTGKIIDYEKEKDD